MLTNPKKQRLTQPISQFIKSIALWTLLSSGVQADGKEADWFVAPGGNDRWSGKLVTPNADGSDGPLATLHAARIKVREKLSSGSQSPINVLIRGGEYALAETIVFGIEDSGAEQSPITYRAFPGERPIFTGGKKLTDWKKVSSDPDGISTKAKGKLWYIDLPSEMKGKWKITTLYDGTTMLPRSRSSELRVADSHEQDQVNNESKSLGRLLKWNDEPARFRRDFKFNEGDLRNWDNETDIEIFLRPLHLWLVNMLPIEKIDTASQTVHTTVEPTYGVKPGNKYQVENAINYLDEPGEWIFSSKEGRIYLWPVRPLAQADIRAPYLQELIRAEGKEDGKRIGHLNFEGLTFRHGLRDTWKKGDIGIQHDWDMYDKGNALMRFRHSEHCVVKSCTFEASSGGGVRFDLYSQRNTVTDSIFAHLGGTGILFSGYGPGTKDENKFNTISNNYIHHVGSIYKHSPGIFLSQSGHNQVKNNTIHDLGYTGLVVSGCRPHDMLMAAKPLKNRREWIGTIRIDEIQPYIKDITPAMMAKWLEFDVSKIEPLQHARENLIQENEIYQVMLELGDGNAIYLSGMGKNNRVERNYCHDVKKANSAIRLDDISPFTYILSNVVERGRETFQIKGPGEIRNNFSIDILGFLGKRFYPVEVDHNIFYNSSDQSAPNDVATYQILDRWSNSLVYDVKPLDGFKPGDDLMSPAKRGKAAVGLLYADPMFDEAAMKQKIFRFMPGSPAIKLGIQPIDLSKVGSTLAQKTIER
jgi:Right handed beta helix region